MGVIQEFFNNREIAIGIWVIIQKVFDHLAQYHCSICKSKKVSIDGDDSDENGMVQKCYLRCEKCGSITEVDFEKSSGDSPSYTTGRGVE